MTLRLREIRPLGQDRYEVLLGDEASRTERVVCRVFARKAVWGVRMDPDLAMTDRPPSVDVQAVAAAVLAYHRERSQAPPGG